jgi:hypothetical protein
MNEHLRPSYKILALGESADGDRFLDVQVVLQGQRQSRLLSMSELQASPDRAINQLGAALLTRAAKNRFLEEAQHAFQTLKPTFRVATKSGWSGGVFVLPNGVCIPRTDDLETCLPLEIRRYGDEFGCLGTLEGWDRIPELAKGNSRFMLAVALAFAGPVVELLQLESPPMIQLFGAPGSGKTSMGAAAGAAWGGGHDGLFLQSWNHTLNSAERLAAAFHSTFLVMDETRTADQTKSGQAPPILQLVMRFAGGQVKGRMTDDRPPPRFETPLLSLSNESLDEMAEKCRAEIDDAHRGRLIDVPLASGVVGAFDNLHGFENHAAFSAELKNIARHHHGGAAREFLRQFAGDLREDKPELETWLDASRKWHLKRVFPRVSTSRDLERTHQKFATIYMAAALAIDYEILPWSKRELSDAVLQCEEAHIDHVARFLSAAPSVNRRLRPVDPLESLRQHVRRDRSKFADLRKGLIPRNADHDSCPGYVNRGPDGSVELLFSNGCLRRLCGGDTGVRRLKDELDKRGWLINEANRGVTRRSIWKDAGREGRIYVTAVSEKAFENQ